MHITNLRKVGGSIMLAIPPALLEVLKLGPGAKVAIALDNGRLVVEREARPHYTLDELLAQCDFNVEVTNEDTEWLSDKQVGSELL